MPIIRPSSDLRNNYNEISTICHQTKSPVYITKNRWYEFIYYNRFVLKNIYNYYKKRDFKYSNWRIQFYI